MGRSGPAPHVKLLVAAGVAATLPSQACAQFIAPHKVTFASSDPSAAAAFAQRYLGATRLSGSDGKPGSFRIKADCETGTCGDCVVGEWVAFRHTRLNMRGVPRAFVKLGFDSFHLHFVKHHHRPTGDLSIAAFERAVAEAHGRFDAWSAWMDLRLRLRSQSLDTLAVQLAAGGVPFLARRTARRAALRRLGRAVVRRRAQPALRRPSVDLARPTSRGRESTREAGGGAVALR